MAAGNETQSSSSQQPPHLPSWRRTSLLMRPPSIKVLPKDNNQPPDVTSNEGEDFNDSYVDLPQKIQQLQRNLSFLKRQHLDTLQQLHKELERLKKENKDLSFKMVMCKCGQTEVKTGEVKAAEARLRTDRQRKMMQSMSGDENDRGSPNDELRTIFLEEEVRELKNALHSERSRALRLMRVIEQKVLEQKSSGEAAGTKSNTKSSAEKGSASGEGINPATLQEYESVIKRLQVKLDQKAHELTQIKADLRDVLYSHKWTPDAYLMARAYVSDETEADAKGTITKTELPDISNSTAPPREMVEKAYQRITESLALPALLPKVPVTVADRKRKAHRMQKHGSYNRTSKSDNKVGFY